MTDPLVEEFNQLSDEIKHHQEKVITLSDKRLLVLGLLIAKHKKLVLVAEILELTPQRVGQLAQKVISEKNSHSN